MNTPEVTGFNNIHFDENMCGGERGVAPAGGRLPPAAPACSCASTSHDSVEPRPLLRYVFAFNPDSGQYDIDVQAVIAKSGLAMWFAIDEEAALS